MTYQHKELAAGRWAQLTLLEQMGHIGSEVERALNWRSRHEAAACQRAFERALELTDLTLEHLSSPARLREIARVRDVLVDYFAGTNQYASTDAWLRTYFLQFALAARKDR